MTSDKIPSIEECYKLMNRFDMLPNIKAHSEKVMTVSMSIFNNLKDQGDINKNLIIAASLLHDITKTRAIKTKTGEQHDKTGGELLRGLGFVRIAKIVENHVHINNFHPDSELNEIEIVCYADKRVMHTEIVSVEKRIADIVIRYGKTPEKKEKILANKVFIYELEKKISSFMKIDINSLNYS